jgi:hypothetical protein
MVLTVGAFIAGALVATIAVKQMPTAVKQMPTAKSLMWDDSLIEMQEAKKNKTQKKKTSSQTRRVFSGQDAKLHEITVLRQFWFPVLPKKCNIRCVPEKM